MSEDQPEPGAHRDETVPSPLFTGATYDRLKTFVQVVYPALITLYTALAGLWDLGYTLQVVGTLTAINAFLGVLLGVSSNKFNAAEAIKAERKIAGVLTPTGEYDELSGNPGLRLTVTKDPNEIAEMGEVTLKVGPAPVQP